MRAVTVPVTATSGIAGLVFPGDRVDLIMTVKQQQRVGDDFANTRFVSHTVLRNLRILAVDQRTENTSGEAAVAKTTTLEVEQKQAEAVALAPRSAAARVGQARVSTFRSRGAREP